MGYRHERNSNNKIGSMNEWMNEWVNGDSESALNLLKIIIKIIFMLTQLMGNEND